MSVQVTSRLATIMRHCFIYAVPAVFSKPKNVLLFFDAKLLPSVVPCRPINKVGYRG